MSVTRDLPDFFSKYQIGRLLPGYPNFGEYWVLDDGASIATTVEQEFVVNFTDESLIYFIDGISIHSSGNTLFKVELEYNGDIIYVAYATGSLFIPFFYFPTIYFISTDSLSIYITNLDGSSRTLGYVLTGSNYGMPSGWVRPPVANFSASPLAGLAPMTVQFTDLSTYSPTSWSWDLDGLGYSETDQNPSKIYSAGGIYSPALISTNAGGSGNFNRSDYIKVFDIVDPSLASETDPSAMIAIAGRKITFTALSRNVDAFVVRDYGSAIIDDFKAYFKVRCTSVASNGLAVVFALLNEIDDYIDSTGVRIRVNFEVVAGNLILSMYIEDGLTTKSGNWVGISVNTDYYIYLYREAASSTVTIKVYTDSDLQTLYSTWGATYGGMTGKKWQYLAHLSSWNDASANVISGYVEDLGIIL